MTEYNYSEDGTCVASTNVYRSPETQYMLHAKKTTMHWKIKDTRAADRTYFTTDCEYIITDEEQLNEKYSDVNYYTYTDFVNKNKSMASHFQQLIYRGLYLEPVQWTIG